MAAKNPANMSLDDEKSTVVKVGFNGRITIPKGMREYLNIQSQSKYSSGDLLEIQFENTDTDETATSFIETGANGRLTIPEGIREYLDLEEEDLVKIRVEKAEESD